MNLAQIQILLHLFKIKNITQLAYVEKNFENETSHAETYESRKEAKEENEDTEEQ